MKNQKGQVILIVLIISALIMTIGLSLSRKAVVETKIDTDEELLKEAFNVAESGIDYYLGTGSTNYVPSDLTKKSEIQVKEIGVSQTFLNFNEFHIENNSAMFWLVGHDTDGNIDMATYYNASNISICVPNSFIGSLKVDYYYVNGGNYSVSRTGYNFSSVGNLINGYVDSHTVANNSCSAPLGLKKVDLDLGLGNTPLLLSVAPIFSGAKVSLLGTAEFPSQGSEISSVGKAGDLENGVNRRVTVQNRYKVPSFLFEAITAGNSITN